MGGGKESCGKFAWDSLVNNAQDVYVGKLEFQILGMVQDARPLFI